MAAHGIDLVDEDDAGGVLLALLEEVTNPCWRPTPTNISTKSEPEMEKNGTPASPATARPSSVLPVPGGPTSSAPLGIRPPSRWNFLGERRKSMTSCSSTLASSQPATSSKVISGRSMFTSLALLLPNEKARLLPDCIWRKKKIQTAISSRMGSM